MEYKLTTIREIIGDVLCEQGLSVSYTHLDVYKRQIKEWNQNIL